MKRPPQSLFGEAQPRDADYFRFRLSPDMSISLGALAKKSGEAMAGEPVELLASHESGSERPPYQRLIGDASRGDQSLFAGEDLVEAAWRVVNGVLEDKDSIARLRAWDVGSARGGRRAGPRRSLARSGGEATDSGDGCAARLKRSNERQDTRRPPDVRPSTDGDRGLRLAG